MKEQYWDKVFWNIDDELLQRALDMRGKGRAKSSAPGHVKPGRSLRRISRSVLIAAIMATLFVGTAVAAAVWKFSDRVIAAEDTAAEAGQTINRGYLSLAGASGTPEYQAAGEWLQWSEEYWQSRPEGWIDDDWTPADKDMEKPARYYMCYDDTMAGKLREIAEKYSLKLHSESVTPLDIEQLYKLTDTAEFILADDMWAVPKYVYEDGSFDIEGTDYNGKLFGMIRSMSGTLPASVFLLWNTENAQEWTYTNFSGDVLEMAITQTRGGMCSFIFYSEGDAHIVLSTELGNREQIESLADCFDFSAACGGETKVMDYVNAPPRAATAPQSASLSAFADSPEYKGIREFVDFKRLQGSLMPCYRGIFPVSRDSAYAGSDAEGQNMLDAMERRVTGEQGICDSYGLNAHSSFTDYNDYAAACAAAGVGDFLANAADDFNDMRLYEDGSFDMNFGFFYYVKKGALCTTTHLVVNWLKLEDYSQSWQYETSSGAVVCCALGTNQGSLILYETPTAWVLIPSEGNVPPQTLEALADSYDFTKLP